MFFSCSHLSAAATDAAACPRYRRNRLAILQLYNTNMQDPKANSQVQDAAEDLNPIAPERSERDSLFRRRMIGAAIIIGLVLLGLAFPVII
jgi:hypothetical protein